MLNIPVLANYEDLQVFQFFGFTVSSLQVQPWGNEIIAFTNVFTNDYKSYSVRTAKKTAENLARKGFQIVGAHGFELQTPLHLIERNCRDQNIISG